MTKLKLLFPLNINKPEDLMKIKLAVLTVFSSFIVMLSHVNSVAAPGDLDPTFGGSGTIGISANTIPTRVRIQSDGKIVTFGYYPYGKYSYISRNNADGTPDYTFGSGGVVTIHYYPSLEFLVDYVELHDGKYLVVGTKNSAFALFRYNSNGTRDASFGSNGVWTPLGSDGSSEGNAIIIQSDGKVIVSGFSDTGFLIRFNQNGSPDESFGINGKVISAFGNLGELTIQPDGKILAWVEGQSPKIVRYNPNGSPDGSFGAGGVLTPAIDYRGDMALSPDGKLVISGRLINLRSVIARYNANGILDASFGINGEVTLTETPENSYSSGKARALVVQRNGKIVFAGDRDAVFSISRLNYDGTADETFGTNGTVITPLAPICRFYDVTIQADGRIVAVGDAGSSSSAQYVGLIRYIGDPPPVTLSGKVTTPNGRGLRNAVVRLTDPLGVVRTVNTSSFGLYHFDDVTPAESYTITVSSKRYRFAAANVLVKGNMVNFDLVGME